MIVDYHVHLRAPSQNGEGPIDHSVAAIERFVEAAAARGVDELGFTEHGYYFRELGALVEHPYQRERTAHDLDAYVGAVVDAKRRGLPVKLGLEVDYLPGREGELADALAPYPWDFLLGSVHVIEGEAVDMEPGLWERLSVQEVWRRYFVALRGLARSGLVDVLAHPDLVKIFGRRPSPRTWRCSTRRRPTRSRPPGSRSRSRPPVSAARWARSIRPPASSSAAARAGSKSRPRRTPTTRATWGATSSRPSTCSWRAATRP
jgi:HisJ family histidinol phosphate phosphatase